MPGKIFPVSGRPKKKTVKKSVKKVPVKKVTKKKGPRKGKCSGCGSKKR